jgi:hypothetical protein
MIADKSYEAMLYFAVRKRGKPNQNNQNLQRCATILVYLLLDFQSLFQQVLRFADLFFFGPLLFFLFEFCFLEVTIDY